MKAQSPQAQQQNHLMGMVEKNLAQSRLSKAFQLVHKNREVRILETSPSLGFHSSSIAPVQGRWVFIGKSKKKVQMKTTLFKTKGKGNPVFEYSINKKHYEQVRLDENGYPIVKLYTGKFEMDSTVTSLEEDNSEVDDTPILKPSNYKKKNQSKKVESDDESVDVSVHSDNDNNSNDEDMSESDDSHDDLEDFNSESDSDFPEIRSFIAAKYQRKDQQQSHVANDKLTAKSNDDPDAAKLNEDAKTIWETTPIDRKTYVTAIFAAKGKKRLKLAFCNLENTFPYPARVKAQELGYTVVTGVKSHAETNMIIYGFKHQNDLFYITHGCDKGACKKCTELLKLRYKNADFSHTKPTGKYSQKYYHQGFANIAAKNDEMQPLVDKIHETYKDDGSKK